MVLCVDRRKSYPPAPAGMAPCRPEPTTLPEVLVKGAQYAVVRPRRTAEELIALDKPPPWLE
jgi:diaminopimelate decarboxylase